MGAGQLARIEGGVANPQGQLAAVSASVPVVAATGKGHLASVSASVPYVAPVGKGQLASVGAVVPSLFGVTAGADRTVEPWVTVTLTASPVNGSASAWEWVQTGGQDVAAVTLLGTGATRTFRAPTTYHGVVLTFMVTATNAGGSATDSVNVTVYPNEWWVRDSTKWVPLRAAVIL